MKRKIVTLLVVIVLVIVVVFLRDHEFHEITSFTVRYSTATIAPPYNYSYKLKGTLKKKTLLVDYKVEYFARQGMTDEALKKEGYSRNDDFHWYGKLDKKWNQEFRDLIQKTRWIKEMEPFPGSDSIKVELMDSKGHETKGVPENRKEWEGLIDKLIDKVYKVSGKKRPPS